MSLSLSPCVLKTAIPFCRRVHRRLPVLQGAMWAVGAFDGEELRGVAIVGRPTARMLDDGARLQVLRVAVAEGTPNGCSILYGATARAARSMGATDLFTYIHDDESGDSLKASGWIEDEGFESRGGEWSRPSRGRSKTVESGGKKRWFAPWSKMLVKPHMMQLRPSELPVKP